MSCTHCGLCLESCPTYSLWGAEPDSPRGRIVIIEDLLSPGSGADSQTALHLDRCLGCMACMSVCPEDVPYADLLATARAVVERDVSRPWAERLRREVAFRSLPDAGKAYRKRGIPHHSAARGDQRGRVGLLLGCAGRAEQIRVHEAALKLLTAEGYEVIAPKLPDCCGAPDFINGDRRRGMQHAQATIEAFAAIGGVDHVITTSGNCGGALKAYGRLLGTPESRAFSALVLDVHELLRQAPLRSTLAPLRIRVAYHDACQLRHVQGVTGPPRELLGLIPGVEIVELSPTAGACCGAPGAYRLTQPGAASALARRQAQAVLDSGAELVVSADHACIEALSRGLRELGHPLAVRHPLEVLVEALHAGAAQPQDH